MGQRLDTRLSRLLLDERALTVDALEEAVQHQVVHGGALDTILLETGVLDEDRVTGALCLAWQTTPVSRQDLEAPDAEAVSRLPRRMAHTMGLCPFRVDHEGVHVLVAAPLDPDLLAEVSELVGAALVPHVVPEVRLHQALHAAYAVPLDERSASLLHSLDQGVRPMPRVSAEPLETHDDGKGLERVAREWSLRDALSQLAEQPSREGIGKVALAYARRFLPYAAIFGVRDGRAVGWSRTGHGEGAQFEHRPLDVPEGSLLEQVLASPSPQLGKPPLTDGNTAFFGWLGRRRPQTAMLIPVAVAGRTVAVLYADGGVRKKDPAALADLVAFGARIGPSFEALLRARHRAHADLFQRGALDDVRARPLAADGDGDDDVPAPPPLEEEAAPAARPPLSRAAPSSSVPSDGTSPFAQGYAPTDSVGRYGAAKRSLDDDDDVPAPPPAPELEPDPPRAAPTTAAPAQEPNEDEDDDDDEDEVRYDELGGYVGEYVGDTAGEASSPSAHDGEVLDLEPGERALPASLLEDTEPVLEASGDEDTVAFREVRDDAPPAKAAWQAALTDTVERGRQGGEAPSEEPVLAGEDDESWEDVVLDAANARQLSRTPPPAPRDGAKLEHASRQTEESPERLVEQLESLHPRVVADAKESLIALADEAVPALRAAFPGRLLVDPFAEKHPPDTAAELGPLIEVLSAIGNVALDAAIPHLDARYPAHRFAATFLFNAVPDERSIELLRARLHDSEPRIRRLAASALSHFVAHPKFGSIVSHLRARLTSSAPETRQRAVWFLGYFRDVGSVPQLIALLDDHPEVAKAARGALKQITLQDLGPLSKAWLKWWKRAKKVSRIDWLLDGLRSRDRDLRYIASIELSRLAGDSFGYRCDDPKRARDQAIKGFESWWEVEQSKLRAGA